MSASVALNRFPALTGLLLLLWGAFLGHEIGSAFAADEPAKPVATAIAVRGQVEVLRNGEVRKLAVKDGLFLNDIIKTGARGRLQLMFQDNTIYSLGSNTELKLKEFAYDQEQKKGKLGTEVKDGVFRVMGGIIAKTTPKNFTAETPVATIGIRGSMYASSYSPETGLSVMFEGGKGITVSNGAGTVEISEPGFGSQVSDWQAPASEPRMMSEQDAGRLYQGMKISRQVKTPSGTEGKVFKLPPPAFSANDLAAFKRGGTPGGSVGGAHAELTAAVEASPGKAAEVLREAILADEVPVGEALEAVLQGMANTDRQQFNEVVKEAVSHGLTVDRAKEILDRLKESGGICP